MKVLLVEDDRIIRITLRDALEDAGYDVAECSDGGRAQERLRAEPFDLLLSDVRLPGCDGVSLFRTARALPSPPAVVLMTAYADTETAVQVMREGARDYVLKPFNLDELLLRVGRMRDELRFRRRLGQGASLVIGEALIGDSAPIRLVKERIEAAAASDVAVLLTGETGTGKDLVAKLVHERSARAQGPFVAVNCAAIPEPLFEAEMFGHEKGAFTGADRRRVGRFEASSGGTLFLDEVAELSLTNQAKLLRAIETSVFEPVGSSRSMQVDLRLIAASNRSFADEVSKGTFRRDLFYRLNVIDLHLPPLREHRSDVPLLIGRLLSDIARRHGRPVPTISPGAAAALATHDYPGNVRELLHALERAVALSQGAPIDVQHLPQEIAQHSAAAGTLASRAADDLLPLGTAVQQFERQYIDRALEKTGGHRGRAASMLRISRKSLWERLKDPGRR
ncbi:MAG: sigma-54-dependent Fis family transcriptional regulator [Deltaproteobacteria bacterium]|nr:sigma-54-dependent Fis family transcriptional regulator [Deltaproteobacteria bacterium]